MRVRCIHNAGEDLRAYERQVLSKGEFGRFGASGNSEFGGLTIGNEYLVMGMSMGVVFKESALFFLVDDNGLIALYPYPFFEVVDSNLPSGWFFRAIKNTDPLYPYREAVWGYKEFVFEDSHYYNLFERDENSCIIYYRRKMEYERELLESELDRKSPTDQDRK